MMKFKVGDKVIFIQPEKDSTIYTIKSIRGSMLLFKDYESSGIFPSENFVYSEIAYSPLYEALK